VTERGRLFPRDESRRLKRGTRMLVSSALRAESRWPGACVGREAGA
jgi:hypothetical protein